MRSASRRVVLGLAATSLLTLGVAVRSAELASVWDGLYTNEQATRGEALYAQGCAECHGAELQGHDMSPPLLGSDFLWDWNDLSVGDLFERVRVSMPDGNPRSMSNAEKADVIAFMLAQNGFPAGEEELSDRTSDLRGFVILAVEP